MVIEYVEFIFLHFHVTHLDSPKTELNLPYFTLMCNRWKYVELFKDKRKGKLHSHTAAHCKSDH